MKRRWIVWLSAWLFVLGSVTALRLLIRERSRASILEMDTCEQAAFREQRFPEELYRELVERSGAGEDFGDLLTATMLAGDFEPEELCGWKQPYVKYKPEAYRLLRKCYEAVWRDLEFFPVAGGDICFEDGWMDGRNYGGERFHEGTDLFGTVQEAGYYPIVSMTDGVVEKKGWLPLGGYRIGIRAPHGGYFYYAHLFDYEEGIEEGTAVEAGDILGYMGNTGYGPEGTAGQFPVHLHLGIYIETPSCREVSVNPYRILRAVRRNTREYVY